MYNLMLLIFHKLDIKLDRTEMNSKSARKYFNKLQFVCPIYVTLIYLSCICEILHMQQVTLSAVYLR